MDEKLKSVLDKVVQLTKQNQEFETELRKALKMELPANSVCTHTIPENIKAIRTALEIRGDYSINYDFIKEERVYNQLYVDNLRMENIALNLQLEKNERFCAFCVNVFYQLENIINYYYNKSYPDIHELVGIIADATKNDENEGKSYRFKAIGSEENVGDIPMSFKLSAFCNTFFNSDKKIKAILSGLRRLRNQWEHRCLIHDKDDKLDKFFEYNTFNSIRDLLIRFVNEVKKQLASEITKMSYKEGIIKRILPSGCFVDIDGLSEQVPVKLFNKVRNLAEGDKIKIIMSGNNIDDIESITI